MILLTIAAALTLGAEAAPPRPAPAPPAAVQPKPKDWKEEFAEICAKTQEANALTDDDLRGLVKRADDLKPSIEKLGESERKVYSKRLEGCRKLFAYVLESRKKP